MAEPRSFSIVLLPESDGGTFRFLNAPGEEQRKHITERGDAVRVQADLVEVIHGKLFKAQSANQSAGDPATLIIMDFRFYANEQRRRFKKVKISVHFTGQGFDPEVLEIAPHGHLSLLPTQRHVESHRGTKISAQGGALGISASAGVQYDLKQSFEEKDETQLNGMIYRTDLPQMGKKDTAEWVIIENAGTEKGIPSHLRTATLVKRRTLDAESKLFQATVEIKASLDFKSKIREWMDNFKGRKSKDDPIIFNPKLPPTTARFDVENLGEVDLTELSGVEPTT